MKIKDRISTCFSIHRRARKKELWTELILFGVVALVLIFLFIHVSQVFAANGTTTPIIASAGALIASLALIWQLVSSISKKQFLVSLALKASVSDHDIFISASVTNNGTKYIYPLKTNLYICQGVPQITDIGKTITFEPINMHKEGQFDCYAKNQMDIDLENWKGKAKDGIPYTPTFPMEKKKKNNATHFAYNCKLLSDSSIMYIKPKESFVEETVFAINNPGYYRIVMIYTDKKWNDCICTSTSIRIV